ncbi:MAG: hypothetical protein WBW81_07890 [Methylocella sp.]
MSRNGSPILAAHIGPQSEGRIDCSKLGCLELRLRDAPPSRKRHERKCFRDLAQSWSPVAGYNRTSRQNWKIRQGQLRFILRLKFPFVPGGDIAGEVVSTAPEATEFKTGDPVVGFVELKRGGGYAELAVAKKTAVALKSPSLSFIEAASLPIAGCTAVQALRDLGKLSKGTTALILGGAGGGHFAVQIDKALGAKTSATCGPANIAFVRPRH